LCKSTSFAGVAATGWTRAGATGASRWNDVDVGVIVIAPSVRHAVVTVS